MALVRSKQNQRFWLMKSEPSSFSFADLQSRPKQTEHWDGVRNFQARNFLRDEIKVGDGVLFYHSNIPDPEIVGVARIVRSGYPDFTALDPTSAHFDPRATESEPIWYMVDVQAVAALPHPLTRQSLAAHPVLQKMAFLKRGNRLSVQEVTPGEWAAALAAGGLNLKMNDGGDCGR